MTVLHFPLGVTNAVEITSQDLMALAELAADFSMSGDKTILPSVLNSLCDEGIAGPHAVLALRQLAAGHGLVHPDQIDAAKLEKTLRSVSTPYFYALFDSLPRPPAERDPWANGLTVAENDFLGGVAFRNVNHRKFDYGPLCDRLVEDTSWKEFYSGGAERISMGLYDCLYAWEYAESVQSLSIFFEDALGEIVTIGNKAASKAGDKWLKGLARYLAHPDNKERLAQLAWSRWTFE